MANAEKTPQQIEFFETRIRPILAGECYECHGAEKQEGGLRLDSRDALLLGGDSGPAIVPGDPTASLLLESLQHPDVESRMPKDRPALPANVITDFNLWIKEGAADPRDAPPAAGDPRDWQTVFRQRSDWWSFKPLTKPDPPSGHATHPVDRFLDAKLHEHGLSPSPAADRATLLRRTHFALTGLPPSPDEISSFLADPSPDAFALAIEPLLASPRFGERWARHWMDLFRFAETHGSEGDPDIPHAWRYRDYLIRAINNDVPWDLLIREHIAGDLLEKPRLNEPDGINESIIGPSHFRLVEHGYQPIDTLDEQVKTVDNQIDVISKAFQGLTVSCARCHDHKFDPISQQDYFALYGILSSVRPGHVAINIPDRLRAHNQELTELKQSIRPLFANAWNSAADQLLANLTHQPSEDPATPLVETITSAEQEIALIHQNARAAAMKSGTPLNSNIPFARWTFDEDARDLSGSLHGSLEGGAIIKQGRLILDGKGAFLQTPPVPKNITAKTLEAWFTLNDLNQRGGGVITIESADGNIFDSIVFAEAEPFRWISGSDSFNRTKPVGGPAESASTSELVHMAIVYGPQNQITLYRNGAPYGNSYSPSGNASNTITFTADNARILLGRRHTGGGNAFFNGSIEEARLHDRALTPEEIARSYTSGTENITPEQIENALTPAQRIQRDELTRIINTARTQLAANHPDHAAQQAKRQQIADRISTSANNPAHPLHLWLLAKTSHQIQPHSPHSSDPDTIYQTFWDAENPASPEWFSLGINPPQLANPGDFSIEPTGDTILSTLLPAGVYSHLISSKHHGIFTSPKFRITSDSISILAIGGHGARVRLIPDQYPIGADQIFPEADINHPLPTWIRLDTAYRKGTMAHLEIVTADDSLSRNRARPGPNGRSFFGLSKVVFHDGGQPPEVANQALSEARDQLTKSKPSDVANHLHRKLKQAIASWENDTLSEPQRAFLNSFIAAGLLPTSLAELPNLADPITAYRTLEASIPSPQRAPGVWETTGTDAPLMIRGDHHKLADIVPRGYLSLISEKPYQTHQSGRLELAIDLTSPNNPLTARVMVNRIWHHLFGRGIVPTVDNFGRLGDTPTHPELLDYLASRFIEHDWSAKEMIRFLMTSEAWQRSSTANPTAQSNDPGNQWLSHARVRRLEAESVRDSLIALSGQLDNSMFGLGSDALAPPASQQRRSIYLTIRRNALSPFLEAFDSPRPFTTLGKRDATNVPGQSLALLNDPFVIEQADRWATKLLEIPESDEDRTRRMFQQALARPPHPHELTAVRGYLTDLSREHGPDQQHRIWRDLAQSIFNLKEFIYLR
jgi:hypothetical protein